jgi:hypothetical protein
MAGLGSTFLLYTITVPPLEFLRILAIVRFFVSPLWSFGNGFIDIRAMLAGIFEFPDLGLKFLNPLGQEDDSANIFTVD